MKVKKVCKQVINRRSMEANKRLKCYSRRKIKPKAFAISVLTALGEAELIAVRIRIANALGFIFLL